MSEKWNATRPGWKREESARCRQLVRERMAVPRALAKAAKLQASAERAALKKIAIQADRETKKALRDTKKDTKSKMLDDGSSSYELRNAFALPETLTKQGVRNRQKAKQRRALRCGTGQMLDGGIFNLLTLIQQRGCAYCGDSGDLHLDHITPLAIGGQHTFANLQWLCAFHNLSKHDVDDHIYREARGIPSQTKWDRATGMDLWFWI